MREEIPQTSQEQPVDESKYTDVWPEEAEARSRELEQWSDAVGKYAEGAARIANDVAAEVIEQGGHEGDVKEETRNASSIVRHSGVKNNGKVFIPTLNGYGDGHVSTGLNMEVWNEGGSESEAPVVLRSPASFSQNKPESQPVAESTDKPKEA